MNRPLKLLKFGTTAVLSVALFLGSVPLSVADVPTQIVNQQAVGPVVMVKLHNPGSQPHHVSVAVQATVLGIPLTSSATANLAPGQSAMVGVAFLGVVQKVITVGVSDDPNPL